MNKNLAIKIFFYQLRSKNFRESYGFDIDKLNYDNTIQWIRHIKEGCCCWYSDYDNGGK